MRTSLSKSMVEKGLVYIARRVRREAMAAMACQVQGEQVEAGAKILRASVWTQEEPGKGRAWQTRPRRWRGVLGKWAQTKSRGASTTYVKIVHDG